jgi:hypothetical protein
MTKLINNIIILSLINVGQNNDNIIINGKHIYFFKIKSSSWFGFNNENDNFKYVAETLINLIILFFRNSHIMYCSLNKIIIRQKLYKDFINIPFKFFKINQNLFLKKR